MNNLSLVNEPVAPVVPSMKAVVESEHNERPTFTGNNRLQ